MEGQVAQIYYLSDRYVFTVKIKEISNEFSKHKINNFTFTIGSMK